MNLKAAVAKGGEEEPRMKHGANTDSPSRVALTQAVKRTTGSDHAFSPCLSVFHPCFIRGSTAGFGMNPSAARTAGALRPSLALREPKSVRFRSDFRGGGGFPGAFAVLSHDLIPCGEEFYEETKNSETEAGDSCFPAFFISIGLVAAPSRCVPALTVVFELNISPQS